MLGVGDCRLKHFTDNHRALLWRELKNVERFFYRLVADEVRDRRRANPFAALVRLEVRLEAVS